MIKFGWITVLLAGLFSMSAHAQQYQQIKQVEAHYSAFNSSFLTPKIARHYQIKRNGYTGLLNISVLDTRAPGKPAIEAALSGSVKNLLGQTRQLAFRQVKEGDAIYYLSEFAISDEETLSFTIDLDAGVKGQGKLKFTQKFYVEE